MTVLRTARLVLRPFADEDRRAFAALNTDAEVMAEFPAVLTPAQSDAFIDFAEAKRAQTGFGFSAVATPEGQFLGMCGLNAPGFPAPFMPCVEIGWRFARGAWGKGYATEAAQAWLGHGFGPLGLNEIVSFTATTNKRSEAVMQRIGMTRDIAGDFRHPGLAPDHRLAPHVLYRLGKEDFDP